MAYIEDGNGNMIHIPRTIENGYNKDGGYDKPKEKYTLASIKDKLSRLMKSNDNPIISLPEGETLWLPEENPLKEELKKAILKMTIIDGSVDLYDVLQVIDQVFLKDEAN